MERGEELTAAGRPESDEGLEKVVVELGPDHWSGKRSERMWAKPCGDGRYEIRNTPWYAYDLNWGDIVRCEGVSEAGLPVVVEIVRPSGHQTVRLIFEPETHGSDRERVLSRLNELNAWYENADGRMYSVDIEPEASAEAVLDLLAREAEQRTLSWETGWTFKGES